MEELSKTKERLIELRDALYDELYDALEEKYYCPGALVDSLFEDIDDEIKNL